VYSQKGVENADTRAACRCHARRKRHYAAVIAPAIPSTRLGANILRAINGSQGPSLEIERVWETYWWTW